MATRRDGTRVVLARGLRIDRAKAIVEALSDVAAFSKLQIAPEPADDTAERR